MSDGDKCYVRCPWCARVSAMAAEYSTLTLCEHCGRALPQRRHVVTITRRDALGGGHAPLRPNRRLPITDAG